MYRVRMISPGGADEIGIPIRMNALDALTMWLTSAVAGALSDRRSSMSRSTRGLAAGSYFAKPNQKMLDLGLIESAASSVSIVILHHNHTMTDEHGPSARTWRSLTACAGWPWSRPAGCTRSCRLRCSGCRHRQARLSPTIRTARTTRTAMMAGWAMTRRTTRTPTSSGARHTCCARPTATATALRTRLWRPRVLSNQRPLKKNTINYLCSHPVI